MTPPRSIGAAAREALDVLAAEAWPLFVAAILPELAGVALVQTGQTFALSGFWGHAPISGALALAAARGIGVAIALAVAYYFIRAFAWGAVCEVLAQRARGEPRSGLAALSAAAARYGFYLRSYGAFLIPAATVAIVGMSFFAGLVLLGFFSGGALGWLGAAVLGGLAALVLLPFWLWSEAFEFLIAPASLAGEFGLPGYRNMRQRVRGQGLSLIGLRLLLSIAAMVGGIGAWLVGLALPSSPSIDWMQLLNQPPDLDRLLQQFNFAPTAFDWLHACVDAVPDALVFTFGAAMAWCWLRDSASEKT